MAKKRRKHEEEKEEKEYKPPEFDEREFLEEEISVAKGTIVSVIVSIPIGVGAFFAMLFLGSAGGLLVGLVGIMLLKYILPLFKVEVALFKTKHWLGVISSYFFMFLAVWVLLCNPPFSDFAGPQFTDLEVRVHVSDSTDMTNYTIINDKIIHVDNQTLDIWFGTNTTTNITIRAVITDNKQVDTNTVQINIGGIDYSMYYLGDDSYTYTIIDARAYDISISAEDVKGNNQTFTFLLI